MKKISVLMTVSLALVFSSLVQGQPKNGVDNCFVCHEGLGDGPSKAFKNDVHYNKGISCAGCHGGDSKSEDMEQGMSKSKGFIGVPKGDDISKACARCHSDAEYMVKEQKSPLTRNQDELIRKSVHGRLSLTGKEQILQCTTCHGSHGIVSVKNPASPVNPVNVTKTCAKCHSNASYMRNYNPSLPVDQLDKYRTSIHGIRNAKGDMKVAECASCHGSHEILAAKNVLSKVYKKNIPVTCGKCHKDPAYMKGYNLPSDQLAKFTQSVHGKALLEKGDLSAPSCNSCHGNHGAAPPGVESVSKVCGTCHALNASLFAESPHKQAFDKRKLPECETCHGHHEILSAKDELVGVDKKAVCSWCHKENENRAGYFVAKTMRELIDTLLLSEQHSIALVEHAEQKGMEIDEAKFKLRAIRQARLETRTMVHAFNEDKFREVVDKGMKISSEVADEAQGAVDEYFFRRWGTGIATIIITLLAVALYLTIRRIEKRQARAK